MLALLTTLLFTCAGTVLAQDTLRFAWITDLHFGKTSYEGSGELLYPDKWLKQALYGISHTNAEFIMLGGDLIESSNSATQYALFDAAMQTALPWYPMPGNHDIGTDSNSVTMAKINAWIGRGYGRGPYNREFYGMAIGDLAAIFVLNTQAFIATDPTVHARAEQELAELDSFFTAHETSAQKIVCAHVPLFTVSTGETPEYFNVGLAYRYRILDLMRKHHAAYYIAGHRHVEDFVADDSVTIFSNTALSFQLGTGNVRGYYIYTVTRDTVLREKHLLVPAGSYDIGVNIQGSGRVAVDPVLPYYDTGSTIRLTATPDSGWKFSQWQGPLTSTQATDSFVVSSGQPITAVFVEEHPHYPLGVRVGGQGSVVLEPAGGSYVEGSPVVLRAQPAVGWEFAGWWGGVNGTANPDTVVVTHAEEVKALFHKTGSRRWSLAPLHDSYVRGSLYAGNNFNSDTTLKVQEGGSDLSRLRSYLQFSLDTVRQAGGTLIGARLLLQVAPGGVAPEGSAGASVYACEALSDSWTETNLTWKTAPAEGTASDSCTSINYADQFYSWDVTSLVATELSGDGVVSLLLKDKAARNILAGFSSRESKRAMADPVLEVETEAGTDAIAEGVSLPQNYRLEQNYPNPFNPSTEIRYSLASDTHVRLAVYDLIGREISLLLDGHQNRGNHSLRWDGSDNDGHALPSGCYLLRMTTPHSSYNIKMMLLK